LEEPGEGMLKKMLRRRRRRTRKMSNFLILISDHPTHQTIQSIATANKNGYEFQPRMKI